MKPLILLSLLFANLAFAGPMQEINSTEDLEAYMIGRQFNGVLYVEKNGEVLWNKAYGVQNFSTQKLLEISDKFQIGSTSKQFTSAAILKLQEEGKLSIGDPISKYLPGFSSDISIRDILNHSAGVKNYTDVEDFWKLVERGQDLPLDTIVDFISKLAPDFAPRTQWAYSNSGYILAGKIVEVVSGQSWHEFIRENFLLPLGMNNTGYEPRFETVSPVLGYTSATPGGGLEPVTQFSLSWAGPAGGLYSTVEDMAKWESIYSDSPLLSEESKHLMQTPFLRGYGLGLQISKFNGETLISHGGRTPGFVTNLSYLKESKLKVVEWDNLDGHAGDIGSLALQVISAGHAEALKFAEFPVAPEKLNDYVGTYRVGAFSVNVSLQEGRLYLQPNDGQPPYLLIANDVDSFRLQEISGEEFIRNEAGAVIALKHYQNGGITELSRQ